MDTDRSRVAYRLTWELDHLEAFGTVFDAELIPFSGAEDVTGQLWRTTPVTIKEPVVFESNSSAIGLLDYPYTNVRWTIVSQQMHLALLTVKDFSHQTIPIEVRGDFLESMANRFSLLQILEHSDSFDATHSVFEQKSENKPGRYLGISSYALNVPNEGFPPIFRIRANPTELFVSGAARDALKKSGIRGLAYQPLVMSEYAPEVDVPVPVVFDTDEQWVN